MKKGDIIRGYTILQDFVVIGGQSRISFCRKNGVDFFIKEFLSPKYPVLGAPGSPKTLQAKKKSCKVFEQHHKSLNDKIAEKVTYGGNLIFAIDFFRVETTYFKINEKIEIASITPREIVKLPIEKRILICKTVCHSLNILHSLKIVHGDIKPDNVLIKKTETGNYTTKLIDFDNSYFSENPPENEENLVGDQVYYSPEMAKYILNVEKKKPSELTVKSDIFALGVLFTEYLIGKRPSHAKKYNYAWEALINGDSLTTTYPKTLGNTLVNLLKRMLSENHKERPSISEVFNVLKTYKKIDSKAGSVSDSKKEGELGGSSKASGILKGSLLRKREDSPKKDKSPSGSKLKGSLIRNKKNIP